VQRESRPPVLGAVRRERAPGACAVRQTLENKAFAALARHQILLANGAAYVILPRETDSHGGKTA